MSQVGALENVLSPAEAEELLQTLGARFEKNPSRHRGLSWDVIRERLLASPARMWSLHEMERTGGEPDVVELGGKSGELVFVDCAAESPKGRRSLCYDRGAWESRKEHKPEGSALEMAEAMGVEILTEDEYRRLQTLGDFDLKTSSWLRTPASIRKLGGAVFGDRRYDTVFLYHNGAESYYASRGFRALLRV